MSRAQGQVPVVAYCTAGHTTRAVSDPGRLTWEGICGEPDCGLKVKGKRAPADALPPLDDAVPAGDDDTDRYRVREVTSYRDDRTRPAQPTASDPDAGEDEPATEPAAATKRPARRRENSDAPAPPTSPEAVASSPIRRGRLDRLRDWFTDDTTADDEDFAEIW
jgi:hypothetical protein